MQRCLARLVREEAGEELLKAERPELLRDEVSCLLHLCNLYSYTTSIIHTYHVHIFRS